jgi:hypothetical protein
MKWSIFILGIFIMKTTFIFLLLISFIFSSPVRADCDSNDQACINSLLVEASNANSDAAITGALVIAGVSWAVYAILNSDDEPEKVSLRAIEASKGLGIRINSFDAPYRISMLQPIKHKQPEAFSSFINSNRKFNYKLVNFEYKW